MGTERDFVVKKGLKVAEDIELGHASDTTIARASAGQITVEGTAVVLAGGANHDGFSDFVANEHIDHSGVSISAGSGLTGGGTIAANRTLTVGAGNGITVNTNDVAVTAAQTTITSVLNTGLVAGRDAHNQIKFSTDDQIIFRVGNADGVIFKASGEIEATKFDGALEGNADTASVANRVVVVANNAAGSFVNENNLILFSPDGASSNDGGNLTPESSTAFHYNPSTTILTVPKITSEFTGNVDGTATNATAITLGGHLINDVDIGTEFVDTDDHLMSSGAIREKIESYGYGALNAAITTIGTGSANAKLTSSGSHDLVLTTNTNAGFTEPYIQINDGAAGAIYIVNGNTANSKVSLGRNANSKVEINGQYTLPQAVTGTDNYVLTANTNGTTAWAAASGGGALNGLTDVISNITNFTDSILISPDGAAPPHGTLSSATGNVGLGKDVFAALTSGTYNTGIGHAVMDAHTTGEDNVAIGGRDTMGANTTGNRNVAIGSFALATQDTHSDNVAVGYMALRVANGGEYNTALGNNTLKALTSGTRNVAIGHNSLDAATSESDNIAIGYDALGGSVNGGDKNVMIGSQTGDSLTSGTENVGVGYQAHTGGSGFYNVAVGSQAGKLMTSNSYQTLVGYQAGQSFNGTNAKFNTAIGYQAMGGGTSSPHQNTALGAGALYNVNGVSRNNIGIGYQAGINQTAGSGNVIIGSVVDVASTTGSRQLAIAGNDGSTTTTWIQGNSDGIVLGALTPLFYERAALDTNAVDFRVPTVQSSSANPNGYPMPFAGKVVAASFLFAGSAISTSGNTNTIRIRKNGGTSGSDIKEFTFTEGDLNNTNGNQYTLVKSGSDVLFTFAAGDVIQVKRQSGSTDLNNSQAMLWVSYNF